MNDCALNTPSVTCLFIFTIYLFTYFYLLQH